MATFIVTIFQEYVSQAAAANFIKEIPVRNSHGIVIPKVTNGLRASLLTTKATEMSNLLVIQVQSQNPTSEPDVDPVSAPMPNQRTSIPFPSRRNDERRHEKANDQIEKFIRILEI
ncbi:hypothetical protein Tco_1493259 [Tanacetum coccineum]